MNTARIVVLAIAVGAGGIAAYLASGSGPAPDVAAPAQQKLDTVDVLVAKGDLGPGVRLAATDIDWQAWPASTANSTFIRRTERPDAIKQLTGAITRYPFISGEPIREQKLVLSGGSGFLAAILPGGMRAVAVEISVESSAGGFILPNDRVDVIQTRRERLKRSKGGSSTETEFVFADVIIQNVRVLAVDQTIEEKDGQKVILGKTVTLELAANQTAPLARARQMGTISLALRSLSDANGVDRETPVAAAEFNIIRFGVADTSKQEPSAIK